jgi:uncharacterized protein (DUF488 family)
MTRVYSIGHSNQHLEDFMEVLQRVGIESLVDVRSQPVSRFSPQFNRKRLADSLEQLGMHYLFMGDALGGRPSGREFYDANGYVLYNRLAETPEFKAGLARLMKMVEAEPVAVMCAEEDPAGCHRRLLVGRALADLGVSMLHLRRGGAIEAEESFGRSHQLTLDAELQEWRSRRPVRPSRNSSTA